jgi:hypothetical protein
MSELNLTATDIDNFEKRFNVKLPPGYREFLLRGKREKSNKIFFSNETIDIVLNDFLPLINSDLSVEQYIIDFKINQKLIPKKLIPIADDAFGNIICISTGEDDYGYLYFGDHEVTEYEDGEAEEILLETSLERFLDGLQED